MFVRYVRMIFLEDKSENFKEIFEASKDKNDVRLPIS